MLNRSDQGNRWGEGGRRADLELVCHDFEGKASKRLLVIRLPCHLLLWVIHSGTLRDHTKCL